MSSASENTSRLQRVSGTFQSILNFLIFSIPLIISIYWAFFNHLPVGFTDQLLPVPVNKPLSAMILFFGLVVSLILAIPALYGIFNLKNLFKLYRKKIVFSHKNAEYILRFGYSLIGWVAAKLIFIAFISAVLTFGNQYGERMIVLQFEFSDIAILVSGSVIVIISWIMKEAAIIKEEQKYTI
ncbi:DUF2975 domain-containing protein [Motilimonas sp. 1_MG-2023]|uniref:DUF2975 domain-containing protein n=1 Tax=Motilimonas sp. 1_MG-2023 TaxID=3062672 RepID=UPI0026E43431|nr:DUF2975 domain-containing protein [Motilimonas sp. 1_MG-2023]MDO6528243.1 DUF2975 domain-containing protein [Motilimonas sp. 1_MG-2023]